MISLPKLLRSFAYALRGIKIATQKEQTFRIGLIIAALVILLAFFLPLSTLERALVIFAIFSVLGLELINTTSEKILDIVEKKHHPQVKDIKDMMAGVVFLAVLTALIIGLLVFWPYFQKII